MAAKRHQRRRSGSLGSLKSALWATVTYNLDVIEDADLDHELRQKACNSLTQAALAYLKVIEGAELQKEMAHLEHLANGNGHHG
jgi:hypothetical protein